MEEDILKTEEHTKTKIINAVLETIADEGEQSVTVRGIAKKAGVNPGLVNYYFGAKQRLMSAAFKFVVSKNLAVFGILKDRSLPPDRRLVEFFSSFLVTLLRHPGIVKTQFSRLLNGTFDIEDYFLFIKDRILLLMAILSQVTGIRDRKMLTMKMLQWMSAVIYPVMVLSSGSLSVKLPFDLREPEARKNYIELLVNDRIRQEDTHG